MNSGMPALQCFLCHLSCYVDCFRLCLDQWFGEGKGNRKRKDRWSNGPEWLDHLTFSFPFPFLFPSPNPLSKYNLNVFVGREIIWQSVSSSSLWFYALAIIFYLFSFSSWLQESLRLCRGWKYYLAFFLFIWNIKNIICQNH